MATVTDIIARQNDLFGLISRSIDNLNKLGAARITRGAVQSRLGALKANWEKFTVYHDNLVEAKHAEIEQLPYVTENVYSLCKEKFHEAHGFMLDVLDQFIAKRSMRLLLPAHLIRLQDLTFDDYRASTYRGFPATTLSGAPFEISSSPSLWKTAISWLSKSSIT
ncbi:hypothetical protein ALC60_11868 [Trachymyrmex zeteki]|uniref:Uncharacterized protein n=1 Tax=Mycetomoellerius zeteki TaxID=64791 RepID=A0A151WMN6_9HYME|nr:hypothetical protein ALC60_11868 [Trachymyrmex zeteki]